MLSVAAAAVAFIAATVATTVIAVVVAASATAAVCRLELFGCGIAHFEYFAFEAYVLAGQRVVEVHDDFGWGYINHDTVDMVAVGGHHRDYFTFLYHFFIEFAFDLEDRAFEVCHLFGIVRPECFVALDGDVEFAAFFQTVNGLLEWTDHSACHSVDDFFWVLGNGLVHQNLAAVGLYFVEVIT